MNCELEIAHRFDILYGFTWIDEDERKEIMACECVDKNGSLLDKCLGTCSEYKYYEQKLIDCEAGMSRMLSQFRVNLENIERDVCEAYKDMYLDGFRKGFEMAKDIYQ